jgi:hypothetical protein
VKRGGGCRSTYFNVLKRLPSPVDVPEVVLTNKPPATSEPGVIDLLKDRFGRLGRDS